VSKIQAVFKVCIEHICITVTYLIHVTKFVLHLTRDTSVQNALITFTNTCPVTIRNYRFMYTKVYIVIYIEENIVMETIKAATIQI